MPNLRNLRNLWIMKFLSSEAEHLNVRQETFRCAQSLP